LKYIEEETKELLKRILTL